MLQLIWKNFDAVKLAQSLIDLGIVNNLIAILAEHSTVRFLNAIFTNIVGLIVTFLYFPRWCRHSEEPNSARQFSDF